MASLSPTGKTFLSCTLLFPNFHHLICVRINGHTKHYYPPHTIYSPQSRVIRLNGPFRGVPLNILFLNFRTDIFFINLQDWWRKPETFKLAKWWDLESHQLTVTRVVTFQARISNGCSNYWAKTCLASKDIPLRYILVNLTMEKQLYNEEIKQTSA